MPKHIVGKHGKEDVSLDPALQVVSNRPHNQIHDLRTGRFQGKPVRAATGRRRIDACHPNRLGHYIIALELVRLATGAQLSPYGTAEGLHAGFDLVFSGNRRAGWSKLADSFPGSAEPFLRTPDSRVFTVSDAAADPAVMLESAEILRQQGKYASAERLLSRAAAEYGEWRAISTVRRNLAASRTASLTGRSETGAQPAAQSATATAFPYVKKTCITDLHKEGGIRIYE